MPTPPAIYLFWQWSDGMPPPPLKKALLKRVKGNKLSKKGAHRRMYMHVHVCMYIVHSYMRACTSECSCRLLLSQASFVTRRVR